MSGSAVFADPWVAAFGGSGVRCYLDVQGGVCRPTAVLPAFGSTGTSVRNLAEWFSVAASTTARGMCVVTADVEQAVSSPRSAVSDPGEKLPAAPGAYARGDDELLSAVAEVARAIRGRELPLERADRNDGFCYLDLVREEHVEEAKARYGRWPVFRRLLDMPLGWFREPAECVEVGVSVRSGTLHFQRGGGDGLLSAYDLMLYGRVDVSRARGLSARLPEAIMNASVGGLPSGATAEPPIPCECGERSVGSEDTDDTSEQSYLKLFLPRFRREIAELLGPCPRADQLVLFPDEYYAPASVLTRLSCYIVGDTWRLAFLPDPGLTAAMVLDLLRRVSTGVFDPLVVGGIGGMFVGDPTCVQPDPPGEEGFCYESCFLPIYRDEVRNTLGPWPRVHELVDFPGHYYVHDAVLLKIGVHDYDGRLHFGERDGAVLTAWHVLAAVCGRVGSLVRPNVRSWTRYMPVGGPGWRELSPHRDADLSCVARLLLDVWGRPALGRGRFLHEVFPRDALARMPQSPALSYPATVAVTDGGVCVTMGHVGGPGAISTTLGEAFQVVYDCGLPMCVECSRDFLPRCGDCGFQLSEGHLQRCRPPDSIIHEREKRLAWEGDALHLLDVRRAILDRGVPMAEATIVAQRYISATAQAVYVATVQPQQVEHRTERQISTWFEANYQGLLREDYLVWLRNSLSRDGAV